MDDFDRNVYCLLGLPLDAVGMSEAARRVRAAATEEGRCFLSTPNLNFLIACQADSAFRDSVIQSDLSVTDGMPLVWVARLLGLPIGERVPGSDLFEALRREKETAGRRIAVFFFGGQEGAAEHASRMLNESDSGLVCVGFLNPGFGSIEDMSSRETIECINASGADFVVAALGARKGQAWIQRNLAGLSAPVISHLGAVVNFVAGRVSRAPQWMQRAGLEWIWRITEEPALWRRYFFDGLALLRLLVTRVLPYLLWLRCYRPGRGGQGCAVRSRAGGMGWRIEITGSVPDQVPEELRKALREVARMRSGGVVDLSDVDHFGPGFLGQLLMLKKHQDACGVPLRIDGLNQCGRRLFHWNAVDYLLTGEKGVHETSAGTSHRSDEERRHATTDR